MIPLAAIQGGRQVFKIGLCFFFYVSFEITTLRKHSPYLKYDEEEAGVGSNYLYQRCGTMVMLHGRHVKQWEAMKSSIQIIF